ncbi:MAG: hypothetical protein NTZ05_08855, partial [Chloroflexi bacterium]|nr:hypothetical protein [Chloroflexota bacterium]
MRQTAAVQPHHHRNSGEARMHWANVITLDQPFFASDGAVRRAAEEEYRPLLRIMRNAPQLALTVSISGALAERLEHLDLTDVIDAV